VEDLTGLLLPLAFIAILYLLLIRPQQKRRKEQQAMVTSLEVGDDVVTIGGLYGRVVALTDRTMDLEVTADSDVVLRFERGSLGRVVREEPSTTEVAEDDE
jgi:preprotein translocase subunit YajC